jgi:hypothetical protein
MISLNLKAVVVCFNLCYEVFSGRRCLALASSGVAGSGSPGNPAMPSLFKADLKDYIPKNKPQALDGIRNEQYQMPGRGQSELLIISLIFQICLNTDLPF